MRTPGGLLLALAVLLPFIGMLLGLVAGGRHVRRIAFATLPVGLTIAAAIASAWLEQGELVYLLGDWAPPLGIALRADGPAVAMILAVAFFAQFLAETLAICLASGIVGAALGALAVAAMAHAVGSGSLMNAPPLLLPGRIVMVVATLAGVGVAAGVLPALRAARIDPAVSLRGA